VCFEPVLFGDHAVPVPNNRGVVLRDALMREGSTAVAVQKGADNPVVGVTKWCPEVTSDKQGFVRIVKKVRCYHSSFPCDVTAIHLRANGQYDQPVR
jgi:hypothetical protein